MDCKSSINWLVVLVFVALFISVPTLVVIITSYLLGVAAPLPAWQVVLWSLAITPVVIILSRVAGFFVKLFIASLGTAPKGVDLLMGVVEFGMFWVAYELLFDQKSVAFAMAASTMLLWAAVNAYLRHVEDRTVSSDQPTVPSHR